MLILTRKIGEKIMIGDNITITVLGLMKGYQLRLGIDAPRDIVVNREEVHQRIRAENQRPQTQEEG